LLTKVSYTKFKFKHFEINENYNTLSKEHLKNSKTSIGSYLDLELSTLVKIFEIYIVKQSPKIIIYYRTPSNRHPPYLCMFAIYLYLFTPRNYNDGARIIFIFLIVFSQRAENPQQFSQIYKVRYELNNTDIDLVYSYIWNCNTYRTVQHTGTIYTGTVPNL
jgi:hypothetical protein